jgi:hypothetical protein
VIPDNCPEQGFGTIYRILRLLVRRGFIDTYRAAAILIVNSNWLFQLGELGFGGDEKGDVGAKVFPKH